MLNQLRLPFESVYEPVRTANDAWHQIREMKARASRGRGWDATKARAVADRRSGGPASPAPAHRPQVRGAPAIAIVAALGVAVELAALARDGSLPATAAATAALVADRWAHLQTSRPTAVNLFGAAKELTALAASAAAAPGATAATVVAASVAAAERMLAADVADNERIGRAGADEIAATTAFAAGAPVHLTLLTHCNTGSLATAGYGTALGIVRAVHARGQLAHVYCTKGRG